MATPKLGIDEISESQSSKYATHNAALRAFEVLITGVVDRRTSASPPGSPSDGDSYIALAATLTGDWSAFSTNDIIYYDSGWYNITPAEGLVMWVNDEDTQYAFNGSSWTGTL